jgi:hypothetical protein
MAQWTRTQITVNGRTYGSIDEMPPDVRRQYERAMSLLADKNNNGVPDILEGGAMPPPLPPEEGTDVSFVTTTSTSRSFVNGREVSQLPPGLTSELPPGLSSAFSEAPGRRGVTIRLTWGTMLFLALLLAAAGALVAWVMQS